MYKILIFFFAVNFCLHSQTLKVGSKNVSEGCILCEIVSQLLENNGYKVERVFNIGTTQQCFEMLKNGAIDIYPEYTDDLEKEILQSETKLNHEELNDILKKQFQLEISEPYGYSNNYALAVLEETSAKYKLHKISELKTCSDLDFGLSKEFLWGKDGWTQLAGKYELTQKPREVHHEYSCNAMMEGKIQLTDALSIDGQIPKYKLITLEDDKNFFTKNFAVSLFSESLNGRIKDILNELTSKINETDMQDINEKIIYDKKPVYKVATAFLRLKNLYDENAGQRGFFADVIIRTLEHLKLTLSALIIAVIVSLPLIILIRYNTKVTDKFLKLIKSIKKIPSYILLLIPLLLLFTGVLPTIILLLIYGLAEIIFHAVTGLSQQESDITGLTNEPITPARKNLFKNELPNAVPEIIIGIKNTAMLYTALVTLAAFKGTGGFGQFLISGISAFNLELIFRSVALSVLFAYILKFMFGYAGKKYIARFVNEQIIN